ncbi:MAG: hypothetical protein M8354_08910 [Halalkalicoccus sp.]|nr:hypothetical protein [Halalkalicoccus sp.]
MVNALAWAFATGEENSLIDLAVATVRPSGHSNHGSRMGSFDERYTVTWDVIFRNRSRSFGNERRSDHATERPKATGVMGAFIIHP